MNDYLLIIDGSSLLSTQFFGNLPREILFAKTVEEKEKFFYKIMKTSGGVYTNAVYGFLKTLFKILKEQKPTHLAITWDLTRDTFRRRMYPPYKGNRSETLEPLKEQFELCQNVLSEMGVPQFMSMEYEADDFSGSLAKKFEKEIPVRILTKDHDYLQLISDDTKLWLMMTDKKKADEFFKRYKLNEAELNLPEKCVEIDRTKISSEFSVLPEDVPSLKGLQGDSSDNIPGVKGVGPDTALKLIGKYHRISALFEAISEMDAEKEAAIKAEWKEIGINRSPLSFLLKDGDSEVTAENGGVGLSGKASALLSEKLAEIYRDIPIEVSISDLVPKFKAETIDAILNRLEITSLKVDFLEDTGKQAVTTEYTEITDFTDLEDLAKSLQKEERIGVSYVPERALILATEDGKTLGISEENFITKDTLKGVLAAILSKGCKLFSLYGKELYKEFGFLCYDNTIAAYLLNPTKGNYPLDHILSFTDFEAPKGFEAVSLESVETAVLSAKAAVLSGKRLESDLRDAGMWDLYTQVELKTMGCLADMECAGIRVEKEALKEFSAKLSAKIDELTMDIYGEAGEMFNLNSPKQLSEILFKKMGIPYPKKNAKTFSTNADILDHLKADYPIVRKILEYRTYAKLRSTYAEGLQSCVSADGRIHGTFNQTVTATGRISSTEPNLQNIPVRLPLGREIRKLFVPEEGCVFIDADYSQIELRVMAHMSGDENLISAYNHAADIHRMTASKVFHVPYEEVSDLERSRAKAVNFGIIYGISAFSLSEDLGISKKEADQYIESYFEAYPGIKKYLTETVDKARETETLSTLFGRIRPITGINSANFQDRSANERIAMNSPIQGTAADIMKMAVIRVSDALKREGLKSRIVLQVHDEIIIEAPISEAEQAEKLLLREMEQAATLSVKLEVSAKRGYSWYETK